MSSFRRVFNVRQLYTLNMGKLSDERVNIEKGTFLSHIFHFLLSGGKACLFPFLTIYFRLLGLSATQVGLVFAAQAFMRLWCVPLWTSCAKACKKKKLVLMISTFVTLTGTLMLSLAPPVDLDHSPLYCRQNANMSHMQKGTPTTTTALPPIPENVSSSNNLTEINVAVNVPSHKTTTTTTKKPVHATTHKETIQTTLATPSSPKSSATPLPVTAKSTTTTAATVAFSITTTGSTTTTQKSTSERHKAHPNNKHDHSRHDSQKDDRERESSKLNDEVDELMEQLKKSGVDINSLSDEEIEDLAKKFSAEEKVGSKSKESEARNKRSSIVNNLQSKWTDFSSKMDAHEYKTFIFILAIIMATEVFAAPLEKLADDTWFEYLDILDVVEKYEQHKVWKTVGYMLLPPFVCIVVQKTNCILLNSIPHFMIHFFMFSAFVGLAFIMAFGYPMSQNKRTPKQARFGKGIRLLCCDFHSFCFTLTTVILGMAYALIQNFLLWKVQDAGGTEVVMGVAISVSATSAFFMHFASHALIKRITYIGAVVLALITLAGRLVFYSFLWTPWVVVAGEALHGFSFTLLWDSMRFYPDFRINPFVMDRSAYTMFYIIYHGLAFGVGSLISGYLYDTIGIALVFQCAAVAVAAWCALFLLLQKCVKRKTKVRYARLLQEDHGDDDSSEEEDWLEVAMKSGSK